MREKAREEEEAASVLISLAEDNAPPLLSSAIGKLLFYFPWWTLGMESDEGTGQKGEVLNGEGVEGTEEIRNEPVAYRNLFLQGNTKCLREVKC